jgi:hypothetical protein
MMGKPSVFLRVAAVATFIQAVAHTIGGVYGDPPPGPGAAAVQAMKANRFPLMGNTRSYWDFYHGFGLGITISLAAEAVVFWLLGSLAKNDAQRLRPILATFFLAYAALGVVSEAYFFPGPVIAEIFITACLGLALFTAQSPTSASTAPPAAFVRTATPSRQRP